MGTRAETMEFLVDQLSALPGIRTRKMFGEYMVYVNNKPILLVCDDAVFVKILPCLDEVMRDADKGIPYKGAKEHYILDIDNASLSKEVITILEPITAVPKPRKKKQ